MVAHGVSHEFAARNPNSPQRGRKKLDRFCRPLRGLAVPGAFTPTAHAVGYKSAAAFGG
jgi:hypothetical protein